LSAANHEHVHTLWRSGSVECVLVSRNNPLRYWVQVCVSGKPFLQERVEDPDEAATVAERFWAQHADAHKLSRNT